MIITTIKTYSDLIRLATFEERFEYLRLRGIVGNRTFGHDRYLNQMLYTDNRWRRLRDKVIIRDNGCDLGDEDYPIPAGLVVHHILPLRPEDIENPSFRIFDLENLICVSSSTHKAIHYGDAGLLPKKPLKRFSGDTCPWLLNDYSRRKES